ncbi:hypothetical protein F4780DRAFT_798285 [Xylariomycetidae sp. FL0641]|nr:hypothetical protein F4780DRAFT_798285 [Xylariomycetidae sp. FL0641]
MAQWGANFLDEDRQKRQNYHFKTSELASMNSWLWFRESDGPIPGGHSAADKQLPLHQVPGVFTIDEDSWYPVFKKSHWFDYKHRPYPSLEGFQTETFSVDNPQQWDAIKPSLEILHELMHGIMMHREWALGHQIGHEPSYNFEPAAEMGHSFEKYVFGGMMNKMPWWSDHPPLALFCHTWPSNIQEHISWDRTHPSFSPGFTPRHVLVPTMWASRLLSAEFWGSSALSSNDLKVPVYFWTENQRDPLFGEIVPELDKPGMDNDPLPYQLVWDSLVKKHQLFVKTGSNRYHDEALSWKYTPWARGGMTPLIEFQTAWDEADELVCAHLADQVMQYHNTPAKWPTQQNPDQSDWIFYTIGLLMLAALPIRLEERWKTRAENYSHHYPSASMRREWTNNGGLQLSSHFELGGAATPAPYSKGHDVVRSRITGNPHAVQGEGPHNVDDQGTYLRVARSALDHVAYISGNQQIPVSKPWIRVIYRLLEYLEAQRKERDRDQWAEKWPYQVPPEYEGSKSRCQFDNATWEWVDV